MYWARFHYPGQGVDARALLQDPITFFMHESKRITWVGRVAALGPDYMRPADQVRPSADQIHFDNGTAFQQGCAAAEEGVLADVLSNALFFERFSVYIGS